MKEIKIDIKTDTIQALLEGKKVVYDYHGQPRITLIPDRYGVFMTHEKMEELKHKIYSQATMEAFEILSKLVEDNVEVKNHA